MFLHYEIQIIVFLMPIKYKLFPVNYCYDNAYGNEFELLNVTDYHYGYIKL